MGGGDAVWAIPATATASRGGVEAGGGGWTEAGGGTGGGRVQAMMTVWAIQATATASRGGWRRRMDGGWRRHWRRAGAGDDDSVGHSSNRHCITWRLAAEDGRRLAAALEEGGCRR